VFGVFCVVGVDCGVEVDFIECVCEWFVYFVYDDFGELLVLFGV